MMSAYTPTDDRTDRLKDDFNNEFPTPVGRSERFDTLTLADDFGAQVGNFNAPRSCLGGRYNALTP